MRARGRHLRLVPAAGEPPRPDARALLSELRMLQGYVEILEAELGRRLTVEEREWLDVVTRTVKRVNRLAEGD